MDAPPPPGSRPSFPAELTDVAAELEARFCSTPMFATMGLRLDGWGPGWATVSMQPTPALCNLAGSLHGGATFALADTAFEIACNSYGRLSVALETSCHYHRPAPLEGRILADAWELSRGGRTASYRLQVTDASGEVLISYLALAYRTSRWHLPVERFPDGWG